MGRLRSDDVCDMQTSLSSMADGVTRLRKNCRPAAAIDSLVEPLLKGNEAFSEMAADLLSNVGQGDSARVFADYLASALRE
jgi:hypothetical protein